MSIREVGSQQQKVDGREIPITAIPIDLSGYSNSGFSKQVSSFLTLGS